jgi:hypothetical protein
MNGTKGRDLSASPMAAHSSAHLPFHRYPPLAHSIVYFWALNDNALHRKAGEIVLTFPGPDCGPELEKWEESVSEQRVNFAA